MSHQKSIFACVSAAVLTITTWSDATKAQGSAIPHAEDENRRDTVEEIEVTARRQSENILDVPVSISAISGDDLTKSGLSALSQIDQKVPNVYFSRNVVAPGVGIRGLYTFATNLSIDPAVGISADEVFLGSPRWLDAAQFDVDRIEILKGPQGTYFGKNTTAGLINITTRGPTDELEGYVRTGYEFEQRERLLEGAIGGPIDDKFGARIALRQLKSDGWLRNRERNDREPSRESFIGRLSLNWEPTDHLMVSYKLQREDTEDLGVSQELAHCSAAMSAALTSFNVNEDCAFNRSTSNAGGVPGFYIPFDRNIVENESWLHALKIAARLGDWTLTSVTSRVDQDIDQRINGSMSGLEYFSLIKLDENKTFSQELRLQTPEIGPLQLVAGVYYANIDFHTYDIQAYDPALVLPFPATFSRFKDFTQENVTGALFAEGTLQVTDAIRLLLGGRYTQDRKTARVSHRIGSLADPFDGNAVGANLFGWNEFAGNRKRTSYNFSPAFTAQYFFSAGQVYTSYKEGFKSGGFDSSVGSSALLSSGFEFDDETAKSYELGFKMELLGRRVRLTGALFRTEFSDLQLTALVPPATSVLVNAASVVAEGADMDSLIVLGRGVQLNFSAGYVDSKYTKYPNAPCFAGQTAGQGCIGAAQNLAGRTLGFAPRFSASAGIQWEGDIGNSLLAELAVDSSYRSGHNLDIDYDPLIWQGGYTLYNARASLGAADNRWKISLIGRNLFDKQYSTGATDVPFFARSMTRFHGLPQTIQLQAEANF